MHHIGEEHRYLLVLRRLGAVCDWRAAVTTELGSRAQPRAAGPTGEARRCQCTATVATVVRVSIVSLLVSDVRHIAVRSPTRSFANVTLMGSAGSLHVYLCLRDLRL